MKLNMYVVLCIIFPLYSMDTPQHGKYKEEYQEECKRSVVSHIVSVNAGTINMEHLAHATQDLLKRKIASELAISTQLCCHSLANQKHCNKHSGNLILLSPDRQGYVKILGHIIESRRNVRPDYCSWDLLRMPWDKESCGKKEESPISGCAFNVSGTLFAAASGSFLGVWDVTKNIYWKRWNRNISSLIQKIALIKHVAFSESGWRIAMSVALEKSEDLRILVLDTVSQKLLYNLKAHKDHFFYMLGEDIIADRLDKHCCQYDLDAGDKTWNILEQKQFLYDIYQRYEETKQKVCLKQGSEWLETYQKISDNYLLKAWLDERVYVEGTTGWLGGIFGH